MHQLTAPLALAMSPAGAFLAVLVFLLSSSSPPQPATSSAAVASTSNRTRDNLMFSPSSRRSDPRVPGATAYSTTQMAAPDQGKQNFGTGSPRGGGRPDRAAKPRLVDLAILRGHGLAPAHLGARGGAPPRHPQARDREPCLGSGGGHRLAVLDRRHLDGRRAHPCLRDPDPGGAAQADGSDRRALHLERPGRAAGGHGRRAAPAGA